jgi:hypothetical protein
MTNDTKKILLAFSNDVTTHDKTSLIEKSSNSSIKLIENALRTTCSSHRGRRP